MHVILTGIPTGSFHNSRQIANMRVIYKNRPVKPSSRRTAGRGVAIIFNAATSNFKERKISNNNHEIVCAKGRVSAVSESIVIIGVYIEPKTNAVALAEINDTISDLILTEKTLSPGTVLSLPVT